MIILKMHPDNFSVGDLQPAAKILQGGGVIAYPTETVYGLGANILHQDAVEKVYQIKHREGRKPLSLMIASAEDIDVFCRDISDYARALVEAFWPGPLTVVLKASDRLPNYVVSKSETVGLRLPDHPLTQALMTLHRDPVTTTSANLSGESPAISAEQVRKILTSKIDMLIDAGECQMKIASTVVDATVAKPRILRAGAISAEEIEECLQGVAT